jgi:diguanylate cyclase (GGDEF)-like protein
LQALRDLNTAIARLDERVAAADLPMSLRLLAEEIRGSFQLSSVAIELLDDGASSTCRAARVVLEATSGSTTLPIAVDERVYGVLRVQAGAGATLGRIDRELLRSLTVTLGLAVERARHRAGEQRRAAQLASLQQLTACIVGQARVRDDAGAILDNMFSHFDFFAITLGLIHGERLHIHRRYRVAPPDVEPFAILPYKTGVTARVIRSGEAAFIHDVTRDPDYFAVVDNVTQEICVPIRVAGRVAGILDFEMDASRQLDDSDFDVARMLADHLGIALEQQARFEAVERRNRQLRSLERITALIARQVLVREAFGEILRELERAFDFGAASIGLIEGDRIIFPAIDQRLSGDPDGVRANGIALDSGVVGRVARSGQPAFVLDVRDDPDYLTSSVEARSEICVPIVSNGSVVGVINVETPVSRPIESEDLEVLTIVAHHVGIALARSDLYAAERRSRREVEGMQRVSRIVASTLDPNEALRRIVATLAEVFHYPFVSFLLVEGEVLVPAASHGFESGVFERAFRVGEHIVGRVAASGQAVYVRDVAAEPDYLAPRHDTVGEICVPIYCGDVLTGVLNVEGDATRPLDEHDLALLQTFAEHAGTLLNNARLYEQMRERATHDPITGLANRRAFQEQLQTELRRAERYQHPLALLIIDVDRFKEVNDRFGHPAGDAVLREIGARLRAELRENDLLARYAGDEFAALLPEASHDQALETAKRLRDAIAEVPFVVPACVELSIGVGCFPGDARDEAALVDVADRRMYQDKRPFLERP